MKKPVRDMQSRLPTPFATTGGENQIRENPNDGCICAICGQQVEGMSLWKRLAPFLYLGKSGIPPDEEGDGEVPGCGHHFIQDLDGTCLHYWLPCLFCETQLKFEGTSVQVPMPLWDTKRLTKDFVELGIMLKEEDIKNLKEDFTLML